MLSIQKIRVENLQKLIGGRTIAAFCRQYIEIDPTYVSQLLNGHRNFGEKAARKMEVMLNLPAGALDDIRRQPWPFSSITQDEYSILSESDINEVEAILAKKAGIIRASSQE